MTQLKLAVLSQPDSARANSVHADQVIELMYRLMEYRNQEIRHRLEKVGRAASMLHLDVLLLIYHFAKFGSGNILEIGPYIGGSTIAAAFGARESGTPKKNHQRGARRAGQALSHTAPEYLDGSEE